MFMQKPDPGEYNPHFQKYIDLVPESEILPLLGQNVNFCLDFFSQIPDHKLNYRYAPGKWTCKDILMHIIDTERVLAYRALVALRGDATTPLPPVDEDLYANNVDVSNRSIKSLLDEFKQVRSTVEYLFQFATQSQSQFVANGVAHPITARALAYIIPGHVLHHIKIIKERYLHDADS